MIIRSAEITVLSFSLVLIITNKLANERVRKSIMDFTESPTAGSKFFVEKRPADENATTTIRIIGDNKGNLKDL